MADLKSVIDKYLEFCSVRGVTEKGLKIVREVIESPPARRVRTSSLSPNIPGTFPSRKMGFTIQAESQSLELSSIYIKEFDESVLGYWDQPGHRPSLLYKSGSRRVRVPVTLDFFVISEDFIGFEECKPEVQLQKLVRNSPDRYRAIEDSGEYEVPPLADYLEGTGLSHRVVNEKHINPVYVQNLALLYDLLDEPVSKEDRRCWGSIRSMLESKGPRRIKEIEEEFSITRCSLLAAIAQQALFANLHVQCLREPERVNLYASAEAAAGKCDIDGAEIIPELLGGSTEHVAEALKRFKFIEQLLEGGDKELIAQEAGVSTRTLERWLSLYRKGGLSSLQPRDPDKGNRDSRVPQIVEECMAEVIEEFFMNKRARKRFHVYQLLRKRCEQLGFNPPSRQAFYDRLELLSDKKVLKTREGAKRAYQVTGYEGLDGSEGEHAFSNVSRYLERCHIDHTQADIQLLSVEGCNLGKPWLTLIVDEYTGFILSAYLSFRNPNIASVMSSIRLMVKDHGVFPEAVVVDGGKEFESVYFETLMASYRCMIISRKGKPRAGGAVERSFGTINTVFLDNLEGSNKLAKNIRQLSDSHNPKKLATWEAVDFYHALLSFINDWNTKSAKSSGLSPAALKEKSIERFGLRNVRKVSFDKEFVGKVLPSSRRPARLRRNKNIQVNRVSYWHACLRSVPVDGVSADVRYDPFDLNYVYVYYQNEWLTFRSTRPQHRNLDDLDACIVAEIARHSLVVNEEAKVQGRMDMAVAVEAVSKDKAVSSGIANEVESENVEEKTASSESRGRVSDLWAISIPKSERGV